MKDIVVVECGLFGWNLIEFQELRKSLIENSPDCQVFSWTFIGTLDRLKKIFQMRFHGTQWTYVYSPRTERNYKSFGALCSLFFSLILILFCRGRMVFVLADANQQSLRRLAYLSSLFGATILSVVSPGLLLEVCSKVRSTGPFLFQISKSTIDKLASLQYLHSFYTVNSIPTLQDSLGLPAITLMGGLYPEREIFFNKAYRILQNNGFLVRISDRAHTGKRNSIDDYWEELVSAKYIITTSFMTASDEDRISTAISRTNHLLYRFAEVFIAKRVLICQEPYGCNHLIQPGLHYLHASTPEDVAICIAKVENTNGLYQKIVEEAFLNYTNKIRDFGLASLILKNLH